MAIFEDHTAFYPSDRTSRATPSSTALKNIALVIVLALYALAFSVVFRSALATTAKESDPIPAMFVGP